MSVTVRVPTVLQKLTSNQAKVEVGIMKKFET